jgi:hypothetical protein
MGVDAVHFSVSVSKNSQRTCGNAARKARSQRDQVEHLGNFLARHQKAPNLFLRLGGILDYYCCPVA